MYRTRGTARIRDPDGLVIINGVRHVCQPPQGLAEFDLDYSRFMFITAGLDRAAVEDSLRVDLPRFQRLGEDRAARARRVQRKRYQYRGDHARWYPGGGCAGFTTSNSGAALPGIRRR